MELFIWTSQVSQGAMADEQEVIIESGPVEYEKDDEPSLQDDEHEEADYDELENVSAARLMGHVYNDGKLESILSSGVHRPNSFNPQSRVWFVYLDGQVVIRASVYHAWLINGLLRLCASIIFPLLWPGINLILAVYRLDLLNNLFLLFLFLLLLLLSLLLLLLLFRIWIWYQKLFLDREVACLHSQPLSSKQFR